MRIAYIDYGYHHKILVKPDTRQSSLTFILGAAQESKTIGDMTEDDHLIVIASSKIYSIRPERFKCKISVCIVEPPFFHGRHYRYLRWFGQKFHRVFTYQNDLLLKLPNARFMAHGMAWVKNIDRNYQKKSKNISLIASAKKFSEGHRLRHEVVKSILEEKLDVEILGRGYRPFDDKEEGHGEFRFSVVIENSREPAYFTEKLIDCFICSCVPIYWGSPDIAHFFNPNGMLICSSKAEIMNAVRNASASDYEKRTKTIEENRKRALLLTGYIERVAQFLVEEDSLELRH